VPSDIPLERAKQTTERLAERLGVAPDRSSFVRVSEGDLLAAQRTGSEPLEKPTVDDLIAVMRAMDGSLPLGPVVDGGVHPFSVEEGMSAGSGRDVPLLVGSTRQEFGVLAQANRHLFEDHHVGLFFEQVGLSPDAARRFAAALQDHHPAEVVGQYVTDVMFRRRIVDWLDLRGEAVAPTWAYDFAWRSAVSGLAEHCLDVPFIFDVLDDPDVTRVAGPEPPQALADQVHAAFVGFVRNQDPGWPSYRQSKSIMVFASESATVNGGYESARALRS
jgi:para-nitrobenzyl esterase